MTHPHDDGRGLFEILCPFNRSHDICPSAIAYQTAVIQPEWLYYVRSKIIVLVCQRAVNHGGNWIQIGPLALSHGYLFPCLRSGVEGMHGPLCRHGISGHCAKLSEHRRIIIQDMAAMTFRSSGRKGIITVRDENVIAQSRVEHAYSVL